MRSVLRYGVGVDRSVELEFARSSLMKDWAQKSAVYDETRSYNNCNKLSAYKYIYHNHPLCKM